MNTEINSEINIRTRKYENRLLIGSAGVFVFGIWSFLKTLIYCMFRFEYFEQLIDRSLSEIERTVIIVIILMFMLLDVLFRFYIRKRAVYEAKGTRTGYVYIFFAIILFLLSCLSLRTFFIDYESVMDLFANVVTELTSVFFTLELIISAFLVKRYHRMAIEG